MAAPPPVDGAAREQWSFNVTPYYTYVQDYIDARRCSGGAMMSPCDRNNVTATTGFVNLQFVNQSAHLYGADVSGYFPVLQGGALGNVKMTGVVSYVKGKNPDTGDNHYHMTPRADLPRFAEAASARDAALRGAAAIALGQSGGRDAVEPLLGLLGDPSQDVRHRAILALGATGTPTAAVVLLRIARTGSHVEGASAGVSPYARSMAIVALALARRAGLQDPIDTAIAAIVRERSKDEREGVALAAMFQHVIAPGESLEKLALELALDEEQSPSVRCRATEALGSTRDTATLSKLLYYEREGLLAEKYRIPTATRDAYRTAVHVPSLWCVR